MANPAVKVVHDSYVFPTTHPGQPSLAVRLSSVYIDDFYVCEIPGRSVKNFFSSLQATAKQTMYPCAQGAVGEKLCWCAHSDELSSMLMLIGLKVKCPETG